MNTPEIPANVNPRLSRIKKLSRILKLVFLLYFVVIGLLMVLLGGLGQIHFNSSIRIDNQPFNSWRDVPAVVKTYTGICCALYLLGLMAFYRLLNLYEKGIIFSAENVSQIRRMGQLAVFYGVLNAFLPVYAARALALSPTIPLDIISSPSFLAGCLTIIVAWVMDEGRKIQEEQDLTI
jgi:hypothetical protein